MSMTYEPMTGDPLYPDGAVPKIPNMPVGADPYWVDWVASLRHENPKNVGELVDQIVFEAICFGGDMGPNGNVWEGIDEGMVWTNGWLNEWTEVFSDKQATCHAEETEHVDISWQDGRHLTIHVMECDACGGTYEHVNGDYEYCPRCGAKVVGE